MPFPVPELPSDNSEENKAQPQRGDPTPSKRSSPAHQLEIASVTHSAKSRAQEIPLRPRFQPLRTASSAQSRFRPSAGDRPQVTYNPFPFSNGDLDQASKEAIPSQKGIDHLNVQFSNSQCQ